MFRMLDVLEAEEEAEEARATFEAEQERKREMAARKENAKKDVERLRKAKEMQKKMGKALIQGVEAAREKEREEKEKQKREDEQAERERKGAKHKGPKKKVSFAELPVMSPDTPQETASSAPQLLGPEGWGDVTPATLKPAHAEMLQKQTMKLHVVERLPSTPSSSRPKTQSPPPPTRATLSTAENDSDDESQPSSPTAYKPPLSDDDEDDLPEDDVVADEFDFDAAQHQREIALQYYKMRGTIGADAARALSAHSHEAVGPDGGLADEWDQPVCILTL